MKLCTNCNFLRSKMKFDSKRYFCRHRGCILDPEVQTCDDWEAEVEAHTEESTIEDYKP